METSRCYVHQLVYCQLLCVLSNSWQYYIVFLDTSCYQVPQDTINFSVLGIVFEIEFGIGIGNCIRLWGQSPYVLFCTLTSIHVATLNNLIKWFLCNPEYIPYYWVMISLTNLTVDYVTRSLFPCFHSKYTCKLEPVQNQFSKASEYIYTENYLANLY